MVATGVRLPFIADGYHYRLPLMTTGPRSFFFVSVLCFGKMSDCID